MLVELPLLLFFLLHCIPGSPSSEEPKWATVSTVFNQPSSHHCSVLFQVSLHLHRHRHCQPCTTSSVVATVHLCALQTIASLASHHCDSYCAPLLVASLASHHCDSHCAPLLHPRPSDPEEDIHLAVEPSFLGDSWPPTSALAFGVCAGPTTVQTIWSWGVSSALHKCVKRIKGSSLVWCQRFQLALNTHTVLNLN